MRLLPGKEVDKVKRFLVTLTCLIALLGAVCVTASAAKEENLTKEQALVESARSSYYRSLYRSGKDSLHGYCGLMTSGQLYALGINEWFVSNDGNDQFDYYAAMDVTSGGYYTKPYYLDEYSLTQALEALCRYGTKDVYNILVGFQWTNTEAGSKYGHAVLINGIIDGTVYFVESFDLSLGRLYPEGSVITCSIAEFAAFYEPWTTYEGLIWFAGQDYADGCEEVGLELTVGVRFDATLRSQPCVAGSNGCEVVREVAAGEQLHATGLLTNGYGDRFYRICVEDMEYYIAEAAVYVVSAGAEDLSVTDLRIPERLIRGGAVKIPGTVVAENTTVSAVEITVSDMQGKLLLSARQECNDVRQELSKLSLHLDTQLLPAGAYLVQVYGENTQSVPAGQEMHRENARVRLAAQMILVGNVTHERAIEPVLDKVPVEKKAG